MRKEHGIHLKASKWTILGIFKIHVTYMNISIDNLQLLLWCYDILHYYHIVQKLNMIGKNQLYFWIQCTKISKKQLSNSSQQTLCWPVLSLNVVKTKFIVFRSKRTNIKYISINNMTVE